MNTKTKDVVKDIYSLLGRVVDGEEIELSPETLDQFGKACSEALKRSLSPRTKGRDKGTLYMSEAGRECLRSLWYGINYPELSSPMHPSLLIKFLYGDILEELVLTLVEIAGHEVTDGQKECEIPIGDGSYRLRGRLDAKIDGEITDVKSASPYSFRKFKEGRLSEDDPFGYRLQIRGYGTSEEVQEGDPVHFLVVNKVTGELHLDTHEHTPFDHSDDHGLLHLARTVHDKENPPDRLDPLPEGKSGNLKLCMSCQYCSFKEDCWMDSNDGKGIRRFMYNGNRIVEYVHIVREPRVKEIPSDLDRIVEKRKEIMKSLVSK